MHIKSKLANNTLRYIYLCMYVLNIIALFYATLQESQVILHLQQYYINLSTPKRTSEKLLETCFNTAYLRIYSVFKKLPCKL